MARPGGCHCCLPRTRATSPRGHGRRGGRPGNGHQSGQGLDAIARALQTAQETVTGPKLPDRPCAARCRTATGGNPSRTAPAPSPQASADVPSVQAGAPAVAWGPYEAAIRRWEHVIGCPVPRPAEPGPGRLPRLSAVFTEWLMGISPGWVTAVPGIGRAAQLRVLGNGVVPQQAAAALRLLLQAAAAVPADPRPARDGNHEIAV